MTRVIHTGDTHLGYRQYHSPARRRDFADAFRRVVADAVDEEVDAVVHAGDLFHDRRPELTELLSTISILRTLADAGIAFLAVVGNHESTRGVTADGARRDAQWLDLFETLGLATRLDAAGTRVGDAVFYGLDHVPRSKRDDLDYSFERRDAGHAALVSHGLFTPFDGGNWSLETVLDESNVAFDAVLLGDNHDPGIEEVAGTWATYCGSTERTSAAERDERGYNIVTFDGDVRISRRGIETRPFVFVDCELHEGEGVGHVLDRLDERTVEDAVVIVTLEGAGEPVAPAEVERFGAERGALVTRVNDRRELAGPEAAVEVRFADPDEAVRQRVRELGLSAAAHRVDRAVRDDAIADSNLRPRVTGAVRDLLDEDPDAFRRVPDPDDAPDGAGTGADETDHAADEATAGAAEADDAAVADDDEEGTDATDDSTEEPPSHEEAVEAGDGPESTDEPPQDDLAQSGDDAADEQSSQDQPTESSGDPPGDGQATWEEFS